MPYLFFDVETRSTVDLKSAGAWRYASHPTTEVLCVGYAVDDGDPQIWTPGDPIPEPFIAAASDPSWNVVAHNYMFERAIATCILEPRYGFPRIPLAQQVCSMTMALASALPGALDNAAAALGLPMQKDREGYKLMRKMSRPLKRRKGDPSDLIRWYEPTPEERERFHNYCKRDVEVERIVFRALPLLSPTEQSLFVLDAAINQRGFHVDVELAKAACAIANHERNAINAEIAALTENEITSVDQRDRILAFVRRHGHLISSLTKRSVSAILAHEPGDAVRRLLELRKEGARASVRKLDALLKSVDTDNRLRGALRFHAASTGRWSGRGYQPQNLKKVETTDIDVAVDAILAGDMDKVRELGAPLTVAADISRSIICAAPGHKLIGADFSAIEGRVLAWLAGEEWKLETYRKFDETGDPSLEPYCVGASKVLNRQVTPEDTAGRSLGKVFDLAFGYGGGLGAWRKFDNSDTYNDAQIEEFKRDYRLAHRATVSFWHDLRRAAVQCVHSGQRIEIGKLAFTMDNGTLRMWLPSGRAVSYPQARLGAGKFEGKREIYFKDNARGAWAEAATWYGLLVENVVQAVARDLLAAAMQRLEAAGYPVVLHVHDEVVCEVPEDFGSTDEFLRLMLELPAWAAGLPIADKPWSGKRYAKTTAKTTTVTPPATIARAITTIPPVEVSPPPADDTVTELEDIPLADVIDEPVVDGKIICPFHDDTTPSLVIYPDHYHCFVCGAHGNAIDWLMMVEGMTRAEAIKSLATYEPTVVRKQDDKAESRAYALQLWNEGVPIAGTLAARYLADTRGIDLTGLPADVDTVLRFHRACPFNGGGVRHPCLIALMRNVVTDEPTGIHRVALTPEAQKIERRTLGNVGAVKLWPAGETLVVGEGIETVLAAATRIPYRGAPLQPAWAMLSDKPLERLPVIPGVERLIVLVDNDAAGKRAALGCVNRWTRASRTVIRLTPDREGFDFNDVILQEGFVS